MLSVVLWVIFSEHFFLHLHVASNAYNSWSLTCFFIIVLYHFFLVWNDGLILCREATEAHPLPLIFSVSLVDVDAEVYDSSVLEVETFVGFSFDRHSCQEMNYFFRQLFH